jgi:hypothetical protein
MPHQTLQRSCSLKDIQTVKDSSTAFGTRPSKLALQQQPTSKYQLWPTTTNRSPLGLNRPSPLSDRSIALSMGRSPTSLSDTAVSPDAVPFWHRGGSLSRRRKVSVPELGGTMATVQEAAVDSRKSTPRNRFCTSNKCQQPFLEGPLSANPHPRDSDTNDPAVPQEIAGDLVPSVMPLFPVLPAPHICNSTSFLKSQWNPRNQTYFPPQEESLYRRYLALAYLDQP